MTKNTQNNRMLDVLCGAFPGGTDKPLISLGLAFGQSFFPGWPITSKYLADEAEEIDDIILRQKYEQAAAEIQERQTLCPSFNLAYPPLASAPGPGRPESSRSPGKNRPDWIVPF